MLRLRLFLAPASLAVLALTACSSAPETDAPEESTSSIVSSAAYAPAPADFDGDGKTDISVRSSDGHWLVDVAKNGFNGFDHSYSEFVGIAGTPAPADYDGDGKADLALVTTHSWRIDYSANGFGSIDANIPSHSATGWFTVPGDYDGDHKVDRAMRDASGHWMIDYASDGFHGWDTTFASNALVPFAVTPVQADYDGDGKTDVAIIDAAGTFYVDFAADGFGHWDHRYPSLLGRGGAPFAADFDGDHRADPAVLRSGSIIIDTSSNGFGAQDLTYPMAGMTGTLLAGPGDFDGDGLADLSVVGTSARGTQGIWAIDYTSVQGLTSFDVMENIQNPAPPKTYCASVDTTCQVGPYDDRWNYFAQLAEYGASHGFECAPPQSLLANPNYPDTTFLYFTTCTDTLSLREYLYSSNFGEKDWKIVLMFGDAYAEDNVCNACLPRAALGTTYVVWHDAFGPGTIGPQCSGGCHAAPGI
jgi:hypothetical protein